MAVRTVKPFDVDHVAAPATSDPVVLEPRDTLGSDYRRLARVAVLCSAVAVPFGLSGWGFGAWAFYMLYTTPPETYTTLIDPVDKMVTRTVRGTVDDPTYRRTVELAVVADTAWRMRRIASDPTVTAEVQEPIEYRLTVRAHNQLAAYWDQHPPTKFFEEGYTRRVVFDTVEHDPVVRTLVHATGRERVLDRYNREVSSSAITLKFWLAANPDCTERDPTRAKALALHNPNCVVVDEIDQGALSLSRRG